MGREILDGAWRKKLREHTQAMVMESAPLVRMAAQIRQLGLVGVSYPATRNKAGEIIAMWVPVEEYTPQAQEALATIEAGLAEIRARHERELREWAEMVGLAGKAEGSA